MRPMRFRAWALDHPNCTDNKLPKKMFYNVGLTDFGSGKWDYIVRTSRYTDYSSSNSKPEDYHSQRWFDFDVKIMQYTGLRDSKGVEIYEGDILEVDYCELNNSAYTVSFGAYMSESYHMLCWLLKNDDDELPLSLAVPCRVIGNIYENPEFVA